MLEKVKTPAVQGTKVKFKVPPATSSTGSTADSGPPQVRKEMRTEESRHTSKEPSREEQQLTALVLELKEAMSKPLASPSAYVSLKKKLVRLKNFLQAHPDLCKELNAREAKNPESTESMLHADLRQMEMEARLPERAAALLSPQGQQERTTWLNAVFRVMQENDYPETRAEGWKAMKAAVAYAREVNEAVGRELQNGKDPDGKPRVRFEYLQKLDAAMEAVHLSAKVYKRSLERAMKAHHKVNPDRLRLADHLESRSINVLKRTRTMVRRAVKKDVLSLLDRKAVKKQMGEVSAVLGTLSAADRFMPSDSREYRAMITSLQKLQNMQKKLEQKHTYLPHPVPVTREEFNACYGEKGTAAAALAAVKRYIRKNEMLENPDRAAVVRMTEAIRMKRYLQTLQAMARSKSMQQLLEEPDPPVVKAPETDALYRKVHREEPVRMM